MKKVFLLTSLLASQWVCAQQKTTSLEVGIAAGANFSSIYNARSPFATLSPRVSHRTGYAGSVLLKYRFTPHLSVQTMIGYEQKGASVQAGERVNTEQVSRETSFNRQVDNNYLTIPLLLTWQSQGPFSFGIGGGGFAAVLVRSSIRGNDSQRENKYMMRPDGTRLGTAGSSSRSNFKADGALRTRRFDYGCTVGGNVSYAVSDRFKLSVHSLLNVGLNKLDKQYDNQLVVIPQPQGFARYEQDYFGLNSRARNISLLVNAGLSYRLF